MNLPKKLIEERDNNFILCSEHFAKSSSQKAFSFEDIHNYGFDAGAQAVLKEVQGLVEALEEIKKTKYGLELSDYSNMEYVADHWAKQALNYEQLAREALKKYRESLGEL